MSYVVNYHASLSERLAQDNFNASSLMEIISYVRNRMKNPGDVRWADIVDTISGEIVHTIPA